MSRDYLLNNYSNVLVVKQLSDIPKNDYGVYILLFNNIPIVLGHGQRNRAKIILDDKDTITSNHIKSIFVRLYHLYEEGDFERLYIKCNSKEEATKIEKELHKAIGGNNRELSKSIIEKLFENIKEDSKEDTLLKIALNSSYSGIADLKKWKKEGIIKGESWRIISQKLNIKY